MRPKEEERKQEEERCKVLTEWEAGFIMICFSERRPRPTLGTWPAATAGAARMFDGRADELLLVPDSLLLSLLLP